LQKKDNFKETEIIEVITSDNPSSKLKEIEEQKEAIKLSDIGAKLKRVPVIARCEPGIPTRQLPYDTY